MTFNINTATPEQLRARISQLEDAEKARKSKTLSLKVGEKGGVSLYGMGRFPVTLYKEQWERLFDFVPQIKAYINAHASELTTKE